MMVLGLPGRKRSTLEQMSKLVSRLRLGHDQQTIRSYHFWADEDSPNPDISAEVRFVAESLADIVVAKSIGTLITMLACESPDVRPRQCVFIGTPLRRLKAEGLVPLLRAHCGRSPTLFIQQTADFNGSHADLTHTLGPIPRVIEIPGRDHIYGDVDVIANLINQHLRPAGI